MSSLIFHTDESKVLVATDTLATSPDGKPFKFTTKAFPLPHLRMIVAGTGFGRFVGGWFLSINEEMLVRGIDHLDCHTPSSLASRWQRFKQEFSIQDGMTTTIYHFGFSEDTGLVHSFAYRSTNDFRSERIQYGLAVKPECTVPDNCCLPRDIKMMMSDQRAVQESRPDDQRVYIGGEIVVHHLSGDGLSICTLDRFEEYARDEKAMYEAFARNRANQGV
jgi:hypothetical protein